MKKRKAAAAFCAAVLLFTGCSGGADTVSDGTEETVPEESGPVRAQDDFYRYVNGEYLENAEFEYGYQATASGLNAVDVGEQVEDIVREIVAGSGYAEGTEEYIIQNAYNSYLAYDFENAGVPEQLQQAMDDIMAVQSVDELLILDSTLNYELAGRFNLVPVTLETNYFDSTEECLTFTQLSSLFGADFTALEDSYDSLDDVKTFTSIVMQSMGFSREDADELGQQAGYMVMEVYNHTDTEQFDALMHEEYFQLYTREQIDEILTNVDLDAYLMAYGIDLTGIDEFGIFDPEQLQSINDMFTDENLDVLKAIELSNLIQDYGQFIYPYYDQLRQYSSTSYDTAEDQAINVVINELAAETDPIYVEQYYTEEMDDALVSMCDDIRDEYREMISEAEWLSEDTRAGLIEKLDNIIYITGASSHRHDPSEYRDLTYDDYFRFIVDYRCMGLMESLSGFTQPVDRSAPGMAMQTLNACYDPSSNSITITVAIMNAPQFDLDQDYYANLGGLGMVIAHEMGHAFDSNCINYDQNEAYNPSWVSDADRQTLIDRNQQAVSYFEDNFTMFGVYHVDGEQTLGENYADLGGMECISRIPETNEERMIMYESFAAIWCEKILDTAFINQIATDVHSPSYIRVNAILSTVDLFYETYGVTEGDGMYIPPENRISRWY